jgi:predicted dehydrogenase
MFKIGVLGFSEGNGHPFSFSAIINGFEEKGFADVGWPGIYDYLRRRPEEDFGIDGMTVTHVWMPQREMARALSMGCRVATVVDRPDQMLSHVDGVLIARDDWTSHLGLARPFLEQGVSVFIDKPLTLSADELEWFLPYVRSGKLMSCAGLRYAVELDPVRNGRGDYGGIRSIRCAVTNDWDKYGVHMIDAAFTMTAARPVSVRRLESATHESYFMEMDDGSTLLIEAHGPVGPLFNVSVVGRGKASTHDLRDNFSSFRRLLQDFVRMLRTGDAPIPPRDVELSIRTLMAGKFASVGGRPIRIDEPGQA